MAGLSYSYWANKSDARIQFWIDRGKGLVDVNQALFDPLFAHKAEIDEAAGCPLVWDPMPDARSAKVVRELPGSPGYAGTVEEWEEHMPRIVEAMDAFHSALDPFVRQLELP